MKSSKLCPVPAHAEIAPVRAYAALLSSTLNKPFAVVTIPHGSAAHAMGYRYVSIPKAEVTDYLANGATLAIS